MITPIHIGDLPADQREELARLLTVYQAAKAQADAATKIAEGIKAQIDVTLFDYDLVTTGEIEIARVQPAEIKSFDAKGLRTLIRTLRETANDDTADAIQGYERVTMRSGYLRIGPGKPARNPAADQPTTATE